VIVVADATPLIALAKISHFTLLQQLFTSIIISQAVYEEVVVNARQRPGASEIRAATWVHIQAPKDAAKVRYLQVELDPGEAETLVLAEEWKADWVLLDESKARRVAIILDLPHIGTIGLLLLAKRQGHIAEIRPLLDDLRSRQFHLSDRVYNAVLHQAGESQQ
jgi:predicted nucleic acid-binding protein